MLRYSRWPDARRSRMSRAAAIAWELSSRLACGARRSQDDQPRVGIVGDLGGAGGTDVHRDEVAALAGLVTKPPDDLGVDLVAAGRQQLLDEFSRPAGHRRLRAVPVAGALDVEVRRSVSQSVERIAVGRDRLAGERARQLHPLDLHAPIRGARPGCRRQEHGAGRTASRPVAAEVRERAVNLVRH